MRKIDEERESKLERSLANLDGNIIWNKRRKDSVREIIINEMENKENFVTKRFISSYNGLTASIASILIIAIVSFLFIESQTDIKNGGETIFHTLSEQEYKEVREIKSTIENDDYKVLIEEAHYNQSQLVISFKVEANPELNVNLEQLVHEQIFIVNIDGGVKRYPELDNYKIDDTGNVFAGIIVVEDADNWPDTISVGVQSQELIGDSVFMFDIERFVSGENKWDGIDPEFEDVIKNLITDR